MIRHAGIIVSTVRLRLSLGVEDVDNPSAVLIRIAVLTVAALNIKFKATGCFWVGGFLLPKSRLFAGPWEKATGRCARFFTNWL